MDKQDGFPKHPEEADLILPYPDPHLEHKDLVQCANEVFQGTGAAAGEGGMEPVYQTFLARCRQVTGEEEPTTEAELEEIRIGIFCALVEAEAVTMASGDNPEALEEIKYALGRLDYKPERADHNV